MTKKFADLRENQVNEPKYRIVAVLNNAEWQPLPKGSRFSREEGRTLDELFEPACWLNIVQLTDNVVAASYNEYLEDSEDDEIEVYCIYKMERV